MEPTSAHSGVALEARELAEKEGITVAAAVARLNSNHSEETKDDSQE